MATYNAEWFISQQIDSILQQKHVEVTLIISDDRSSDRTPEILNQYSKQYSKVIVSVNINTRSSAKNFYSLQSILVMKKETFYQALVSIIALKS